MSALFPTNEVASPSRRRVVKVILFGLFAILFGRLYQLQLLYHTELGKKSEENSIRSIVSDPIRGYIYDRNGTLVVDVGPSFSVTLTPAELDTSTIPVICSLLDIDRVDLLSMIEKGKSFSPFVPTRIKRDIDFESLSALEEAAYRIPGIRFNLESKRMYPSSARASHILGYCREITDAQLERADEFYRQGDLIGSAGVEASYEELLRGQKGYEFLAVNARGQTLGPFEDGQNDIKPREGLDLVLSLDIGLQALAESLMTNHRGALVAMDPNDGGILAMVSKPDFDPSLFSGLMQPRAWRDLNTDTTKPLFNRATMTRYPPGSTFKLVLAAAALQNGIVDTTFRIRCYGAFRFGNRPFKDMHVHGSTNILQAIQRSCNVFFYQLMLKVGLDRWNEAGREFGFGQRTGIDTKEETQGLLPDEAYFDKVYGKGGWTQGYLISLAIGQGEVGVSPLQMARYAAAIANRGTLLEPHVVRYIRNNQTNQLEETERVGTPVKFDSLVFDIMREGMRRVVEVPGGTGRAARIPGIVSAGKTGTAENPHGEDHAWYVGFAPFDNPKIAIAIVLENAGGGGAKAAPIAGLVMEKYLFGEIIRYKPRRARPPAVRPDSTRLITKAQLLQ